MIIFLYSNGHYKVYPSARCKFVGLEYNKLRPNKGLVINEIITEEERERIKSALTYNVGPLL